MFGSRWLLLCVAMLVVATSAIAGIARPTHAQTPLPAPDLLAPAPGEIVGTVKPAFDWNSVQGAKGYRFEIAKVDTLGPDGRFADPLLSVAPRTSSYALKSALKDGIAYVWHVLMTAADGSIVPSETRSFSVDLPDLSTPSPTPEPPTPAPTATSVPPTPTQLPPTATATPSPTAIPPSPTPQPTATPRPSRYVYERASNPARTIVTSAKGIWVATFTDGARTVALHGPDRTFAEASAAYPVVHGVWVRLLDAPFDGTVSEAWLDRALSDSSPDLLAIAMQYVEGAPDQLDLSGRRFAGDASYGPLQADGTRKEGSDFNDFLGIAWRYGTYIDQPEDDQFGAMDCSGFTRMVFGYRSGYPLTQSGNGAGLPRTSSLMLAAAPGVVTIGNDGTKSTAYDRLQPGDLVFFDVSSDSNNRIDHVGIYLGQDTAGNYRFISSRKKADGPTLGDIGGRSILNGTGTYASAFRAARRL